MLANIAAVAAILPILVGVRQVLMSVRPSIPPTMLSGMLLTLLATQQHASVFVAVPSIAVSGAGVVAYGYALWRHGRRQNRAGAVPDSRRIASITRVGKNPQSVVLSADGQIAYVAANDSGTLAIVDVAARTTRTLIRVGRGAVNALPLPGTSLVLVSVARYRGGRLVVVDTRSNRVVRTVPGIIKPRGMAVSRDGAHAYVTSMTDHRLCRLDPHTAQVTGSVEVGKRPVSVVVSPDGAKVYVANFWSNTVAVLDAGSLNIVATIPIECSPRKLALSPDGNLLYAAASDGFLAIVDTVRGEVVALSQPGTYEGGVAASLTACYITDPWQGTLMVLDRDRIQFGRPAVELGGRSPVDVAVGPDGSLYVVCQKGSLDIIRLDDD